MADASGSAVDRAVASARQALALGPGQRARVWEIGRLRAGARSYLLIVFGAPEHSVGIATVDLQSGNILQRARLPGVGAHDVMPAEEAMKRANFPAGSRARLVWDPTPASRSPFYPLWQISDADRRVWVDGVRGTVWKTLAPQEPQDRRGGGRG
jgi:hypothetical protein